MWLLTTSQSQQGSAGIGPWQAEPRTVCPTLRQVVQTQAGQICSQRTGIWKTGEAWAHKGGAQGDLDPLGNAEKPKGLSLQLGAAAADSGSCCGDAVDRGHIWTCGPATSFTRAQGCLTQVPSALPQML